MKTRERGFVLVCVLWVLAILTVISIGFQRRAMMDARASMFTMDHMKAMMMARGAVQRGIVELRNKGVIDALYKQVGRTSTKQRWAHTMDMLQEKTYYSEQSEDLKDEVCKYEIRDEESRICINAASEEFLKNIEGLGLPTIRKIMVRRNGDPDARELPQAFQTLEEVRELEGVKDKHWFGTDKQTGLKELLTCWGDGHLNINTASAEVLACVPDLKKSVIDEIVRFRAGPDGELGTDDDEDFASLDEIAAKAGITGESLMPIQQYCKVDSRFFTIRGIATRRQGKVVATCVATVYIEPPEANVIKWREEFVDS